MWIAPALALALALSAEAAAPLAPPPGGAPHHLRWNPKVDLPVTGVALAGWLGSEYLFKRQLAPAQCHWCQANAFDSSVRNLFHPDPQPSAFGVAGPDLASNVVGFAVLPLSMLGLDALAASQAGAFDSAFPVDAALIAEATFSALVLNQGAKFLVGRARPYTTDAPPELLATGRDPADHNLSFFSGHTTFAFSVVVAAGTIATLRGYRHAWLTWALGLPLACTTGLLRLAADKHWASDVLVGMAIGAGLGAAIPLLLHGRDDDSGPTVRLAPAPGGAVLTGTF